jgi:phage terminase large subunit GpA-like protein
VTGNLALTVDQSFREAIAPEPDLFVWEWAERHRILPPETPEPGPKRYDRTPYLKAIAEALSPRSPFEKIVMEKGSQIGATDLGADWHGHTIHVAPATILIVWPTVEFAQRKSRELIDPLIELTAPLRERVAPPRSKDAQNTMLVKRFPGGRMLQTGANSGVGLKSTAAPKVHLSEVDAFPDVTRKEGDPIKLALRATRNFKGRRKMLFESTPLLAQTSLIDREFRSCDQQCWFELPCPRCGHYQDLVWDRMKWEVDGVGEDARVRNVRYCCAGCEGAIYNHEKAGMLAAGRWAVRRHRGDKSIGFHLSALYSPVGWYAWDEAAQEWLESQGNPARLQTFTNMTLGLPYQEPTDAPAWEPLFARREPYPVGIVPPGVRYLTAACDVQRGWLAVELVGWGRKHRSWSITYRILEGDTTDPTKGAWADLTDFLATDWPCHGGGTLPIRCLAVDSGDNAPTVYRWAKGHPRPAAGGGRVHATRARTVMVTKGWGRNGIGNGWGMPIRTTIKAGATEKARGLKIAHLSTWTIKAELYGWLRRPVPEPGEPEPSGWCHWPIDEQYGERYFSELTAESYTQKNGKWKFDLPSGVRNEALDCRVYARAAAMAYEVDDFTERQWAAIEASLPPGLLEDDAVIARAPVEPARRKVAVEPPDPEAPPPPVAKDAPGPVRAGRRFINSYLQGG